MISAAPLLSFFYGDDFTGTMSTAEVFTNHGVPTLVFTALPALATVREKFAEVRAVGLAGTARSLTSAALEQVLPPVFGLMRDCQAATLLYKVCSTCDSAVEIGSIGRAIEIAFRELPNRYAALLPAAPQFGRFVLFGNLFATAGNEAVYRLDRHPSMSTHPVTPMNEADLLRHLARQTDLPGALVDIRSLRRGSQAVGEEIEYQYRQGKKLVLFDCLETEDILTTCAAVLEHAEGGNSPFFVGSHEVAGGIAAWFRTRGELTVLPRAEATVDPKSRLAPILCVSGSCAPVTGSQIQWAQANGFADIAARTECFLDPKALEKEENRIVDAALEYLRRGMSVLVHTAVGATDRRIGAVGAQGAGAGIRAQVVDRTIGDGLGRITRAIVGASAVRRVVIFGGDTSGAVLQHLEIAGLQVAAGIAGTPAPLSFAYSDDPKMNGLEIALKGGQVGAVDYLGAVHRIRLPDFRDAGLHHAPGTR